MRILKAGIMFCLAVTCVLSIQFLFWWLVQHKLPELTGWMERGQFGDMFGGLNTTFSGLAFAAVTFALYYQRHQLDETRKANTEQAELSALAALLESWIVQLEQQDRGTFEAQECMAEIRRIRKHLGSKLEGKLESSDSQTP